jgi:hypothetical protein
VDDPAQDSMGRRELRTVTRVRRERSLSGSHEHIEGVWTSDDEYFSRGQVIRSLGAGEKWYAPKGSSLATIGVVTYCPWPGCSLKPYVSALDPERRGANTLEMLPTG